MQTDDDAFDPLNYVLSLQDGGIPVEQAWIHAKFLSQVIAQCTTKPSKALFDSFDPSSYIQALQYVGVPEEQGRVHARALSGILVQHALGQRSMVLPAEISSAVGLALHGG